jgi:hypothetical protein
MHPGMRFFVSLPQNSCREQQTPLRHELQLSHALTHTWRRWRAKTSPSAAQAIRDAAMCCRPCQKQNQKAPTPPMRVVVHTLSVYDSRNPSFKITTGFSAVIQN